MRVLGPSSRAASELSSEAPMRRTENCDAYAPDYIGTGPVDERGRVDPASPTGCSNGVRAAKGCEFGAGHCKQAERLGSTNTWRRSSSLASGKVVSSHM